ncbi:heat shock 70 kDa protein 12A-like [Ruditapes philippinarum]|uniref:heat shock 70 kDa protein 12A-like n=1 Tax=Ruditapes philippinarum TaxID=129788 RepID=UPI00295B7D27|nr:heat shock 70 kDa protein 12A-like [Ruditapes philippinarum]
MAMSTSLVVAAIDFGTTFSSWGFSFKHEFKIEPTKVKTKTWTGLESAISLKGPTTILISPDGQTFDSFGFDAETKYAELAEEQKHKEWYFFKRFKMQLYDKINIQKDFTIEDATGKSLMAKTVFSLSIGYLKNDLMGMTKKQVIDQNISEDDIKWVLTIPAIWNDVAKQFMRESAEDAGIKEERLIIALEPEAASIYCHLLPTTRNQDSLGQLQSGSKYVILDAGGGTVDITVHETTQSKELINLAISYSNETGADVMKSFKEDNVEEYMDLMRAFEIKKREAKPDKKVAIRIPVSLTDAVKAIRVTPVQTVIAESKYKDSIRLTGDKLKLNSDVINGFFQESLKKFSNHLTNLLQKPELDECETLLMVGGYSESLLLQQHITKTFPNMKIVVPSDAGLAVLKGAVIYGHDPTVISQRVCKYTYGNDGVHDYNTNCTHPPSRRAFENGIELCYDIFFVHARAGDVIKLGKECKTKQFYPLEPLQKRITFDIFCTKEQKPELVTDPGCVKLGSVTIPMLDTTGGCSRRVIVSFLFGGTDIEVKVKDPREGTVRKVKVSFLG